MIGDTLRMTYPADEWNQPMPKPGREDVFAALHAELDARQAKGATTYGVRTLETFNGRDAHRDLRDELLDALAYEQQRRMERAALVGLLRRAAAMAREGVGIDSPKWDEWWGSAEALLGPDPEAWR